MASGIAHEINNPLSIIKGNVRVIIKSLEEPTIYKEKIINSSSKIDNSVERINQIIIGLKKISREDSGDDFEEVKVRDILSDALSFIREKLKSEGIDLRIDDNVGDTKISCHPVQISQVLLNLLSNAVHAVSGSDQKWIEVKTFIDSDTLCLSVTDSGYGIKEEDVSKIFDPFYTTKDVGVGTGIGLSISKGLIESHKGQLILDESRRETSFVVKLPTH